MRKFFLLFILLVTIKAYAQPSGFVMTGVDYIERYKDDAIREMLLNGIPASITLAQGMVESGNGNSPLATYANNHFGIKCHKDWKGFGFILDDDAANECFRKYASVSESYSDHSQFIKARRWYAPLFQLKITDYKGWAQGLKQAGYATHPHYAEMLIEVIEQNGLDKFDKLGEIASLGVKPYSEPTYPMMFTEPSTTADIKAEERHATGNAIVMSKHELTANDLMFNVSDSEEHYEAMIPFESGESEDNAIPEPFVDANESLGIEINQPYLTAIIAKEAVTVTIERKIFNVEIPSIMFERRFTAINYVNCVLAKEGDTFEKVATDLQITKSKLLKFNDLKEERPLKPGDIIYLQKKGITSGEDVFIVSQGQTVYEVSQICGVQLESLCVLNRIQPDAVLRHNERLLLR